MKKKDSERVERYRKAFPDESRELSDGAILLIINFDKMLKKSIDNRIANDARKARHQAYLDCGMVRVKGALGGVYYE